MDTTEQEAERIFKFIVKKLGYEDACIECIEYPKYMRDDKMHLMRLIGRKGNLICRILLINDISIGIIKGYSWTDMLNNVIQHSNEAKSYCYIYINSINNRFSVPKTLEELKIMVDLES